MWTRGFFVCLFLACPWGRSRQLIGHPLPWMLSSWTTRFSVCVKMYPQVATVYSMHLKQLEFGRQPMLTAGTPCQPLSKQGHQKGPDDIRSQTLPAVLRAAHLLGSAGLVLECVPEALNDPSTQCALGDFAAICGYDLFRRSCTCTQSGLPGDLVVCHVGSQILRFSWFSWFACGSTCSSPQGHFSVWSLARLGYFCREPIALVHHWRAGLQQSWVWIHKSETQHVWSMPHSFAFLGCCVVPVPVWMSPSGIQCCHAPTERTSWSWSEIWSVAVQVQTHSSQRAPAHPWISTIRTSFGWL